MNLRPLHAQAVLLASVTFACGSPDGHDGPTSATGSSSTSGSTSADGESTTSSGDETTIGRPQTSGTTVGSGTTTGDSSEGGSSEGSTTETEETTETTGGETITACGVDNPWLCEDFEGVDPLAAWQIIQAPGNEVSVISADSPAEPNVLRAHSSETANGNVALVRQQVPAADRADVLEAGSWVRLGATCLPESEFTVLSMLLTDPVRRTPIVNVAVHFNEGGGYVYVAPYVAGMSATALPWKGALLAKTWQHVALRYEPASGAVRLTVDDAVLVDGVASAQLKGALSVSLDGGLSAGLELAGACTVLQDDLYLAPAQDE